MDNQQLIQRYLLGSATREEVERLETALENDPELRKEFRFQVQLDAGLRHISLETKRESKSSSRSRIPEPVTASTTSDGTGSPSGRWVMLAGTIAATTIAIVTLTWLSLSGARRSSGESMFLPTLPRVVNWVQGEDTAEPDIWTATRNGEIKLVAQMIRNGTSPDLRSEKRNLAPLHFAAAFGQSEAASLLLDHGAAIDLMDQDGNTALHLASFFCQQSVVDLLLEYGASPLTKNAMGQTSVDMVTADWSPRLRSMYIWLGEKMNFEWDLERIENTRPKILVRLTADLGHLYTGDVRTPKGETPATCLFDAASQGDLAAIKQHIAAGTDLNQQDPWWAGTPVMFAATFGQMDAVELLLKHGANPEIRDKMGGTALHSASFFCQPEVVELLVQKGVDTAARDRRGVTALELATAEWTPRLEFLYHHVYQGLGIEFDPDLILPRRNKVAQILSDENVDQAASGRPAGQSVQTPSATRPATRRGCRSCCGAGNPT